MMRFAANWAKPFLCVSNEPLADAINSPSTSAVMVPISPMPNLTTSFDSGLKWCSGKTAEDHSEQDAAENAGENNAADCQGTHADSQSIDRNKWGFLVLGSITAFRRD